MFTLPLSKAGLSFLKLVIRLLKKYDSWFFAIVLGLAFVQKWLLLSTHEGGGEIMITYLPKTLMVLQGKNPYSVEPSAAPYPPFLFVVLGGILRVTTWNNTILQEPISTLAWNLRVAGLVADLLVAVLIFLALRTRYKRGLASVVPPSIYLFLPSLGATNYYWFHGDIFGYLILAGSLLAFAKNRILIGTTMLALSVIFKLQPILSLALIMIWIGKKHGIQKLIPSLLSSIGLGAIGLLLPLFLPGYLNTIIGFNLSYGAGNWTSNFTLLNVFNASLQSLGLTLSSVLANDIWVSLTATLFVVALGLIWFRSKTLDPINVIVIGLLAWLIPLRTLYPYYLVWGFVPFFFKGNLRQLIVLALIFEMASTLAVWSWYTPPNSFLNMDSTYGYAITSLAFAMWGVMGSVFTLRQVRSLPGQV